MRYSMYLCVIIGITLGLWGVSAAQASSAQYKESCGQCHMAYPPQLLPSGSWQKLITGSDNHFGENLSLDAGQQQALLQYLRAHAAETSSHKCSRKILGCLGGHTPLRITEIPYIIRKHRDVSPAVFARKSVDGMRHCNACHPGAEHMEFKDEYVRIPQ